MVKIVRHTVKRYIIVTTESTESTEQMIRLLHAQIVLAVLAGLVLTAALPVGMFLGTSSSWLDYIFAAHLGLLAAALVCSAAIIFALCHRSPWGVMLPWLTLLLVALAIYLVGSTPIVARDALVHHLAVPKMWLEKGTIEQIPWHEWSYYPMLLDLPYMLLLQMGAQHLTPFYHACYLLLLASAVGGFLRANRFGDDTALVGALLTFTLPLLLRLATIPLVDLGLAYFCLAAFISLAEWSNAPQKLGLLIVSGLSLGLALSTKYNAMPAAALLVTLVPLLRSGKGPSATQIAGCWLATGCVALAVFSPWLIKNTIWTLNPLYPLLRGLFQSTSELPSVLPGIKPLMQRHVLYGESWWEIAALPLRMILFGQDEDPRRFDGVLSPLLLLAVFALFRSAKPGWLRLGIGYVLAYFICAVLLANARVRYLAPLIGPLIIMTAIGFDMCAGLFAPSRRRTTLGLLLCAQLAWCGYYCYGLLSRSQALAYASGQIKTQEYMQRFIPEYPLIEYANSNLSSSSCTYLLYIGNHFYLYNRCVQGSYDSGNLPIHITRNSSDAAAIAGQFLSRGIDHIMAHTERARRVFGDHLNQDQQARWSEFATQHLELLTTLGPMALYRIHATAKTVSAVVPPEPGAPQP